MTQIDIEHAKSMNKISAEFDEQIFKFKSYIDLCLVIDITDSMQPYLKELIKSFVFLVEGFEADHPDINLRVGAVCYRDFTLLDHLHYQNLTPETDKVCRSLTKCTSHSKFKEFNTAILKRKQQLLINQFPDSQILSEKDRFMVKKFKDYQTINHGLSSDSDVLLKLDFPEDIQGALNVVLNKLRWDDERSKFVLHICDAPAHGSQYHKEFDFFPNGSPDGFKLEQQIKEFGERGINYQFVKVNELCNQMLDVMRQAGDSDYFSVVEVKDSRNFGFHTLAFIFSQIDKRVRNIENQRMQAM